MIKINKFQLGDLNSSHHRAALLRMAASLRKQGELGDAHDYCTVSSILNLTSFIRLVFSILSNRKRPDLLLYQEIKLHLPEAFE